MCPVQWQQRTGPQIGMTANFEGPVLPINSSFDLTGENRNLKRIKPGMAMLSLFIPRKS